jgi:SEA/GATOR complex protein SEA1/DEPDC5
VLIRALESESVALDLVELSFREQNIDRGVMLQLHRTLSGECIYRQQAIHISGLGTQVEEVRSHGRITRAGLFTEHTKVVGGGCKAWIYG